MKSLRLLLIILPFLTLTATAQDAVGTNKAERKVLKLINSLPEVVDNNNYMKKHSPDKRELKAYIENTPTTHKNYYTVSVAEFNGMKLVPHFWFTVNAISYTISYWDFENNKTVPLKVWRKHPFGVYSKR